ncbi:hypothetical protein [Sphingobacterium cavernae]|uniref:hypothetical protein n=1 Tax=Sphingobacterium cavernae TaxID=2592657 RepID=UPI0012301A6E|nr:hypothetical protein [Sphingobacterium cavernae]
MGDEQLNIDFEFNTSEALKEVKKIKDSISDVGKESDKIPTKLQNTEGILQRLQRAAEVYKKGMLEATRVDNIEKYSQKLALVNAEMNKLTNGANIKNVSGWNGLQNSINQIGRELPAITYGFQTFAMGISNNIPMFADEVARLRKENEALTASGQKGVPIWRQILGGLLSWQTALTVGVTLLAVYGKEIGDFVKGLFKGKEAIDRLTVSKENLDNAFKNNEVKQAVIDIDNLRVAVELSKKGVLDKKKVVEEYNQSIGKTTGEVKSLYEVEKFLADHAEEYVRMTLYKAAANLALEEAAKSALEAEKSRLKELSDFENRISETMPAARTEDQWKQQQRTIEKQRQDRKDAEIKASEDARKVQLGIANKFNQQAQDIANKMGISVFGKTGGNTSTKNLKKEYEEILKISEEGLAKIYSLDKEYSIVELSDNEKEKELLKQKFTDLRKIIEEENKKITSANKKNKFEVDLINTSKIDDIEVKANAQLEYKQNTKSLIEQFEKEKKIYEEYLALAAPTILQYSLKKYSF